MLHLSNGLPGEVPAHSAISGFTENNQKINGVAFGLGKRGDKTVRVLYQNNDEHSACHVGGSPEPMFDGCKLHVQS